MSESRAPSMSSSSTRSPPICPQLWFEILDYLDPCDYRRLEACCSLFLNLPESPTNWLRYCQRSKIIDEDGEAARRREFDSWACPFTLGIPGESVTRCSVTSAALLAHMDVFSFSGCLSVHQSSV